MLDRVFDFIYDPFGIKKRKQDEELREWIKKADVLSKEIDQALINRDYKLADRLTNRFKYL